MGISAASVRVFAAPTCVSGHVRSVAGSSRWAYALRSGVCPARRRARRTASALLEVAMQSVSVRRMRAFAVATYAPGAVVIVKE